MGRTRSDAIEDLIVLARRGDLPESDERAFRERLAKSPVDRELYDAGRAIDAEAPIESGDAARLDRLVRAVELKAAPEPRRRRPSRIVRIALAALLVGGAAVSAAKLARSPSSVPVGEAPEVIPERSVTMETAPPPIEHVVIAQHEEAVAIPDETPPPPPAPSVVPPTPPPPPVVAPTAAELFAAANAARVHGEITEAIRLSRDLVDRYPETSEAKTSRLSLGMLYLDGKQPDLALVELRLAPPSAEAAWGVCQALRALTRTDEERTALQALLDHYPTSPYAVVARTRLESLH